MECRNSIFAMGEHQQGDGPASDGEYFIPVSKELSAGNYRICPGSAIPFEVINLNLTIATIDILGVGCSFIDTTEEKYKIEFIF